MPSITAKRKCPELIFVPPRFDAYRAVSQQIHAIFAEHTPLIEPLSLDEAYLDVTDNLQGIPVATTIAEMIRAKIKSETGLTASAGVSYNKFLAKLASGQNKPDGLFVITPKAGPYYYWIARGIDERPVRADRERKSVGAEDTFASDLFDLESARKELAPLVAKFWRYCEARSIQGRTVTLKVKFADFQQITRSRTIGGVIEGEADLGTVSGTLLDQVFPVSKGIRLLGVTLSNLTGRRTEADRQMSLTI